jgi:putative transposase
MFLSLLDYKLSERNKILIKVDKWFPSSQICHKCNYRDNRLKDLNIRKWECPVCHEMHDRDINAAINILQEGLRLFENVA